MDCEYSDDTWAQIALDEEDDEYHIELMIELDYDENRLEEPELPIFDEEIEIDAGIIESGGADIVDEIEEEVEIDAGIIESGGEIDAEVEIDAGIIESGGDDLDIGV